MGSAFEKRLLFVWLALSAITLASVWMGADGGAGPSPDAAIAAGAIAIALVKTRIIFREFMEVRHAPARLGRLTDVWLAVTAACLLAAHLAGAAYAAG